MACMSLRVPPTANGSLNDDGIDVVAVVVIGAFVAVTLIEAVVVVVVVVVVGNSDSAIALGAADDVGARLDNSTIVDDCKIVTKRTRTFNARHIRNTDKIKTKRKSDSSTSRAVAVVASSKSFAYIGHSVAPSSSMNSASSVVVDDGVDGKPVESSRDDDDDDVSAPASLNVGSTSGSTRRSRPSAARFA